MIPPSSELNYLPEMTEQQRILFLTQFNSARKDLAVAVLLAIFLGGFGAHKFYLEDNVKGVVYLLFCWTGIPSIIALVEIFFLRNATELYNAKLAARLAAQIRAMPPAPISNPAVI